MGLAETYRYYNEDFADQRTVNWFLMSSPVPVIIILFNYLYFVLNCGPRYMRDSKPWELKTFITYYNIFQIIYNSWLVYKVLTGGWLTNLSMGCEPVDYSLDPMSVQLLEATWWTMILKLIDLSETVVFVLRKKDRQISFLHLYHHITTFFITWLSVKYIGGGMATFPIMVNSTVHVIMYTYYLLSAEGPKVQKILKYVKPYITIIQMVQFCILLSHSVQALAPTCNMPKVAVLLYITNLLVNFYLFYDFYKKNYMKKQKSN